MVRSWWVGGGGWVRCAGCVGLLGWPGAGYSEVAGEILVGVLGQDEPGGGQDDHWVLAWRGEDVDRMVADAVGNDEPFVVGQDDLGLLRGLLRQVARTAVRAVPGGPGGPCVAGWAGDLAAAGEGGGWLGRERGRGEDPGGEQEVLQPSWHAAGGDPGDGRRQVTRPGVDGRCLVAGLSRGKRCLVPGLSRGGRERPRRLSPGCLAWCREYGPRADGVGVGADGAPVGGVQGLPAAGDAEGGGDGGQGVAGRDGIACRPARSRQGQDGARADEVGVGTDGPPVGGVQGLPAARHPESGGDGGQGVAGQHGPRGGAPRPVCRDFGCLGGD